ncbi:ABC transporter B family member 20 [Tanacetum coccineum]
METHEEGEMMEHVDEVNFRLDGLRRGQSVRVRRSSLLNVCGTLQQRRLLRTRGSLWFGNLLVANNFYIGARIIELRYHSSLDSAYNSHESPRNPRSPERTGENGSHVDGAVKEPSIKRQDSFEMRLPELPKIDVHYVQRQASHGTDPELTVTPLLTSDPNNERSHSQTFSQPNSQVGDDPVIVEVVKEKQKEPPMWRFIELSFAE